METRLRKTEIARQIGVPYSTLNYWIMRGAIEGKQFGSVTLYDLNECRTVLDAFRVPRQSKSK